MDEYALDMVSAASSRPRPDVKMPPRSSLPDRHRPIRALVAAGTAVFALAAFVPGEARADLRICNKTSSRIGIAVGYKDQAAWTTEGWWNLPASSCETLLAGPLVSRYYYIYAIDYDRGGEWSGRSFMCTQEKTFTIKGIEDCLKRGHERTGFFEIDTGEQRSWTVQLTEPGRAGLGSAAGQ